MNYKLLTWASLAILIPTVTYGQNTGYIPLVGIPGITDNGISFEGYVNALYALSISVAALLAVIKIIIAGMKWMLSDIVTSKGEAIEEIKGAVFGLIVVISAVLILTVINPQLTRTQIFLEPVAEPTKAGTGSPTNAIPTTGTGYRALDLRTASPETIDAFSRECGAATGSIYRVEGACTAVCYAPLPSGLVTTINNQLFTGLPNLADIRERFHTVHYPRLIEHASAKAAIKSALDADEVLVAVTVTSQNDWLDTTNRRYMQVTCSDLQRSSGRAVTLREGTTANGSGYLACVYLPQDQGGSSGYVAP